MSQSDTFISLLECRGTRRLIQVDSAIEELINRHGALPEAVVALLQAQDGEDPILTFRKGFRFMSARGVADSMDNLREMVEVDETLPRLFLEFVPFMDTEVKTVIGVFRQAPAASPQGIVEYHFETGEFVEWSRDVPSFIDGLYLRSGPCKMLGNCFPVPGLKLVDVTSISWE